MTDNEKKQTQSNLMSRRAVLLMGAQIVGVSLLGARAKYLQIDQNEHYVKLAEDNRIDIDLIPAPRGLIKDTKGIIVAENIDDFRVEIDTKDVQDPEKVLDQLSKVISLDHDKKRSLLREIRESSNTRISVADNLTWQQISLISENLPVLPGVKTQHAQSRHYPYRELLAHQVGYVGKVSKVDKEKMEAVLPIYHTPDMAIGKSGIESKFEDKLLGTAKRRVVEKNANRREVREIETISAVPGQELQTTLDANFHHYAMERMKGESASAVVMDVKTGDIKLLASVPSFDANLFVFGISHNDYNTLLNDDHFPLNHKAVSGQYPPGSTFKMVTALAALEQGIGPGDGVSCRGKLNRGRDFYCWKSSGHGFVNLKSSLKNSCDVYYYTMGERASIDNISKMARRLGLDERYDIPQNAVSKGLIPDRDWKKNTKGEDWQVGDTLNASIGQGFVLTTPLQLAVMTARIASGNEVKPNMIAAVEGVQTERGNFPKLDINPEHLRLVRQGMFAVSNEGGGTAYKTRINADGRQWAGKTGTAQVVAISKAERAAGVVKNKHRPWNRRDHALFVAFAPYDDPQYAISVVVEHGGGGSTSAAPIARDLMLYALYDGVPPLNAYPSDRGKAATFWRNAPPLQRDQEPPKESDAPTQDATNESSSA